MAKKSFAVADQRRTNTLAHMGAVDHAEEAKKDVYRFNLKLPIEQKDYLQEMTWRTRTKSITAYITRLIAEDMERHPEWRDSLDELNE